MQHACMHAYMLLFLEQYWTLDQFAVVNLNRPMSSEGLKTSTLDTIVQGGATPQNASLWSNHAFEVKYHVYRNLRKQKTHWPLENL